jgi:hypothetical protein
LLKKNIVNEITRKSKRKKKGKNIPAHPPFLKMGFISLLAETFAWEKLKHLCEIEFT